MRSGVPDHGRRVHVRVDRGGRLFLVGMTAAEVHRVTERRRPGAWGGYPRARGEVRSAGMGLTDELVTKWRDANIKLIA